MLEKIISWGLIVLVFLVPLFFLPFTSNFYEFNKNFLLLGVDGLLLVAWSLKMLAGRQFSFRRTVFDLPVFIFALTFIASTIISAANKWEAFWSPQATGTILGLTIFYFLITNNLTPSAIRRLLNALAASAGVLALVTILQFVGLDKRFTPAGSPLALITFLLVVMIFVLGRIFDHWKTKKTGLYLYFNILSGLVLIVGLGLTIWQSLSNFKIVNLPYLTSWVIAIETLKNSPLFGVGPASFLEAFTGLRPFAFNSSPLWATRFATSGNWYLNLFTTTGIISLVAFLWLVVKVLKNGRQQLVVLPLLLALVILAFLPAEFLLLFMIWLLLAVLGSDLPTKEYTEEGWILGGITFLVSLTVALAVFWFGAKAMMGEVFFYQSLQALSQNKGTETYNLQIKAISANPQSDFYRLAYSQTNLALANALASNPPASGLTDQDRQNISQLVQQSIQEAKTAVVLNPRRVTNWENLAQIYRSLINFAQGADQWTVAAFQQAISLDPVNPSLRLNLGGVYFSLGNYDQAISVFQQAVNLKPDFANGHYNLAAALREKKNYEQALAQMEVVLALVDPNSGDFQKAKEEADQLKEKVKETLPGPAKNPETLIAPSPAPSPVIKPPLQLPEESSPPTTNP